MSISKIIEAQNFAALRHKHQIRKGVNKTPYINHPINVAKLLSNMPIISSLFSGL